MTEQSTTGHGFDDEVKRLLKELDKYTRSKKIDPKSPHDTNNIRKKLDAFVRDVELDYRPGDRLFQALAAMSRLSYEVGRYCGKDPVVEGKRTKAARDKVLANRRNKQREQKERVIMCAEKLLAEDLSLRSDIDLLARRVESKLFRENKEETPPQLKTTIEWLRAAVNSTRL
jgi:hypothetical protein